MSEFFNNPTSESRHFILSQNSIVKNLNLANVLEYTNNGLTKLTPAVFLFSKWDGLM